MEEGPGKSTRKRVCAIVAHPDDETIFCGGYLARPDVEGHAIVMTLGGLGTWGEPVSREELRETRKGEVTDAAGILGIEVHLLELYEGQFNHHDAGVRLRLVELIREIRPQLVLTHDWDDDHLDHRETALLARDAVLMAGLPNIVTPSNQEAWKVLNVYTFDKRLDLHGSRGGAPVLVDITATAKKKMRALRKHRSQNRHAVKGVDQVAAIEMMGLVLGGLTGVGRAEKFTPLYPRAVPDFPEFLLGEGSRNLDEEP
ncbi:MAG: PIG-L deacetylase family protein [Promethearchaeota archaeon]